MKITTEQLHDTLEAGDVIIIHYLRGDIVSAGIQWWTHGKASHTINSLGADSVVEEDIGGASHTYLDTYMRGQCRLTIKRILPHLRPAEKATMVSYWLNLVGKPYGWKAIIASLFSVPLRRAILPRCPDAARAALRFLSRALGHGEPDCSASWVRAARLVRPRILSGYDPDDVTPETLLRDGHLYTVAVWDAPILVQERKK